MQNHTPIFEINCFLCGKSKYSGVPVASCTLAKRKEVSLYSLKVVWNLHQRR